MNRKLVIASGGGEGRGGREGEGGSLASHTQDSSIARQS